MYRSKIFLFLMFFVLIKAEDLDSILQEYNRKNDLSQKTIDANKGHLLLFNRERLERMHAKTLKDVFKTLPVVYYHENRFSLPDPLTSGAFEPYRSNFIRLYIDGVEVTQGWMGSGVMLYGDTNIDFVDHIEFYYMIPSFETTVEPAYLTIFLYSKDAKQDGGGKLDLVQGSRGYGSQSVSYAEAKEDFSYTVNLSHTNAKRETIDNGTPTPLSRDFERTQLISYFKTDDQIFHLQVMKKNTDSLAGMSYDATPLTSQSDYLNIHMDYGIDFADYWHAQFAYDWLQTDMRQADELPLLWSDALGSNVFDAEYKNSTYTAELNYKRILGKHHINAGVKGRYKTLDSFENNGQNALTTPFTEEKIASVFFQDQYVISQKELWTFGISYNYINRNGNVKNDSLLQLRLGYIYNGDYWGYKTYLYRTQFSMDPSTRYLNMVATSQLKPQTTLGITQEISYTKDDYRLRLILLMMKDKDGLLQNTTGNGKTKYFFSILNYDYNYNLNNKFNFQLYYANYKDLANMDNLEDVSGYFSFMNSYENFDFYNGLVWHTNSLDWVNYFDLTSSVSWNISEDLTLTLKGENLLDRAKKTNIFRVNPITNTMLPTLQVSPIDRRVTFELEYTF